MGGTKTINSGITGKSKPPLPPKPPFIARHNDIKKLLTQETNSENLSIEMSKEMPIEKSETIKSDEINESSATISKHMKASTSENSKDAENSILSHNTDTNNSNLTKQTTVISSSVIPEKKDMKKTAARSRSRRTSKQSIENGESGDEACCIRFGGVIRNKAIDLIPQSKLLSSGKQKSEIQVKSKIRRYKGNQQEILKNSVGDDISIDGCHGVRFADDYETESSTDYRDIDENSIFLLELACHSDAQTISKGESCIEYAESGYYTSDVTTKDEEIGFPSEETVNLINEKSKELQMYKNIENINQIKNVNTDSIDKEICNFQEISNENSKEVEITSSTKKQETDTELDIICKKNGFQSVDQLQIENKASTKIVPIQTKKRVKSPPRPPPPQKSEEIQQTISEQESISNDEIKSAKDKENISLSEQNELIISKEKSSNTKKRVTSPPRPPPPKFTELKLEHANSSETETKHSDTSECINQTESENVSKHDDSIVNESNLQCININETEIKLDQLNITENETHSLKNKEIILTKKMYTFPRKQPPPIPSKPFRKKEQNGNNLEINKENLESLNSSNKEKEIIKTSLSPKTFPRSGKRGPMPISPMKKIDAESVIKSSDRPILTTVVKNSFLEGLQPLPSPDISKQKRAVPSRPPPPTSLRNKITNLEITTENKTTYEDTQKYSTEDEDVNNVKCDIDDINTNVSNLIKDESSVIEEALSSETAEEISVPLSKNENNELDKNTEINLECGNQQMSETQFSTWPIAVERKKRKVASPPRPPPPKFDKNSDATLNSSETKVNKNVSEISSLDSRGRKRVKSPPRPPLPYNKSCKDIKAIKIKMADKESEIIESKSPPRSPIFDHKNDKMMKDDSKCKEEINLNENEKKRLVSPPRPPPPIYEKLPVDKAESLASPSVDMKETISKIPTENKTRIASPPRPPPPVYERAIPKKENTHTSIKEISESTEKVKENQLEKSTTPLSVSFSSTKTTENEKHVTSPPRPPPPIYEKLFSKKVDTSIESSENKISELKYQQSERESVPLSPTSSIAMHEYEEIKTPPFFDENSIENLSKLPPKAPPRVRRNRSRTVEIVTLTEKPKRRKQRSHSLTESDICKKLEDRDMLNISQLTEMKTLYTVVQKERGKMTLQEPDVNEEGRITPNYDKMKFRPLPPPPPPPRSRSRLSASYSPASIRRNSLSEEIKLEHNQQEANFECTKDLTGDDDKLVNCDEIANISTSSYYTVTEQESDKNEENDILENITTIHSVDEQKCPFYYDKSKTKPECKKSQSPIRSKSSSPTKQKSGTSSWYDESDVSGDLGDVDTSVSSQKESMEGINNCEENEERDNSPSTKQKQGKLKTEVSKKSNRSSKFYCDIDINTLEEPHEEIKLGETERAISSCSFAEKSIQTSPEREISSIKDDQSDDTDDLLDRARSVQMELCLMLERRKRKKCQSTDDTKSSCSYSPSPKTISRHKIKTPDDASSGHSHISPQLQPVEFGFPVSSARSSNSELSWQGSSSEESDDEKVEHSASFLKTKKQKKAFFIAREIMSSEEVFISSLKLLNEEYREYIKKANEERGGTIISEEMINFFLRYFPQLQNLNENLLSDLKDRIENWEEKEKIADVIVKIGPFLKLYSSYIRDFDSLETAFDDARKKYPLFDQITKEFELSPKCKKLALKHYMLKPIQRIPQYRLLLQEYFQNLTEESPDYVDTQTALQIVSEVANHANETLRLGDNFRKLVSIQNSLLGSYEIIRPGRIFLKEGELMKLSRKDLQPRWFILFNDSLFYLICMQQGLYKVNYELPLTGMKVNIPQHEDYKNEFSIISITRSFTLAARSLEERQEWVDALNKAIEENASKRSTFTTAMLQKDKEERMDNTFVLGKKAPVWIPDSRVTMCQLCTREFTVTFRRHHCRACGKVVCSLCSGNKAPLQYRNFQVAKVCDECFQLLQKEFEATEPAEKTSEIGESGTGSEMGETDSDSSHALASIKAQFKGNAKSNGKKIKRHLPSVLKEVCANDQGSTISGYLRKKDRKNWKSFWFVLKDKVLYKYKASEDVAALESIPLLGFQVETFTQPFENVEAELLFQLTHAGQPPMIFYTDSPISTDRWVQAMQKATILE